MADKGLTYKELDGIVDKLKLVRKAKIVALITELEGECWKISLRGPKEVDVNTIAHHFGGGGHAKAAGFRITGSTLEAVLDALRGEIKTVLQRV
jgi:phosphoesterase RecJ-like protein